MASNNAGFSFDLCKRNAFLASRGVKSPQPWKTGTTIAGIVFKVRLSAVLAGSASVMHAALSSLCLMAGLAGSRAYGTCRPFVARWSCKSLSPAVSTGACLFACIQLFKML